MLKNTAALLSILKLCNVVHNWKRSSQNRILSHFEIALSIILLSMFGEKSLVTLEDTAFHNYSKQD